MYFKSVIMVMFFMAVFIECFSPYEDDYEYDTMSRGNDYASPPYYRKPPRRYIRTKTPRYYVKCGRRGCFP